MRRQGLPCASGWVETLPSRSPAVVDPKSTTTTVTVERHVLHRSSSRATVRYATGGYRRCAVLCFNGICTLLRPLASIEPEDPWDLSGDCRWQLAPSRHTRKAAHRATLPSDGVKWYPLTLRLLIVMAPVGLVVPVKITTRERIVQPFAHQRILDSVFGEHRFRSVLVCVSEMQRKRDEGANAICVPGTIRLYQRHLAALSGLYYLDPPHRYLQPDVTAHVAVRTLGCLLADDLPSLLDWKEI